MSDCSKCLWKKDIIPEENHFGCVHTKYFNFHLKINRKSEWVRNVNGKFYLIGNCRGFTEKNEENQLKLLKTIMDGLPSE